jgi:hypothetical protein
MGEQLSYLLTESFVVSCFGWRQADIAEFMIDFFYLCGLQQFFMEMCQYFLQFWFIVPLKIDFSTPYLKKPRKGCLKFCLSHMLALKTEFSKKLNRQIEPECFIISYQIWFDGIYYFILRLIKKEPYRNHEILSFLHVGINRSRNYR